MKWSDVGAGASGPTAPAGVERAMRRRRGRPQSAFPRLCGGRLFRAGLPALRIGQLVLAFA